MGKDAELGAEKQYVIQIEQSGRVFRFAFTLRPDEPTGPGEARWLDVGWDEQPYPLRVRAALTRTNEVICTSLVLGAGLDDSGGAPVNVTPRSLRAIPLKDILLCINTMRASRGRISRPGGGPGPSFKEEQERLANPLARAEMPAWTYDLAEIIWGRDARAYRASHVHPGRKGLPPEHFEAIARAYNEIQARNPHSPMKELASQQLYSLAQVRRWVRRAEEMGFRVDRPRPAASNRTARHRRQDITDLQWALLGKGVAVEEASAILERDKGYGGLLWDASP